MDRTQYKEYKQLSIFDFGAEEKEGAKETEPIKHYASPCGGCVCDKCVNNVNCMSTKLGEMKEPCFNCDDCRLCNGKGKINKKYHCDRYEITDAEAKRARGRLRIVRKEGSRNGRNND